ncbi:MAG: TlpA disulfide reductase family protein [Pseudomonadota bacterium]
MKNKNKVLNILTKLGLIFAIAMVITFIRSANEQGEPIENRVKVPRAFDRQFSNVVTKRRAEPIVDVSFLNPAGETVAFSDFDGEYLLVNFWATWCPPCVLELPSLDALAREMEGKGLEVIAISLDAQRDQQSIRDFLYNRGIGEFAEYHDNQQIIQKNIYMRGIPTSVLLDPQGNILYVFEGDADWSSAPALEFFRKVLNL